VVFVQDDDLLGSLRAIVGNRDELKLELQGHVTCPPSREDRTTVPGFGRSPEPTTPSLARSPGMALLLRECTEWLDRLDSEEFVTVNLSWRSGF
jgi:hypothetical protein